ncbi:MAG: tetratricopeptide repeat protein [Deltaproteobacteria bacterium]|nr:tetratricopeptide repeat protein [Deltaproteobacteria bacterium]
MPLTDDQIRAYRERSFVSVPLRIKDLGAFHLEAYVHQGSEELIISSTERPDPDLLFRRHHDLLSEAKHSPADGDVYWNLGVAFIEDGEYHLAWHAFEKALLLTPNDPTIHVQLGKLLGHDLRRVDDAIAAFEQSISSPEAAPEAHVELAIMLRSSRRLDDAEAAVRRGLETHPDDARLLEALGVILIELDRKAEAVPVLEKSLHLHGPDPEIRALLAEAHSR